MNALKTTLCFGATVSVLSTSTLTAYAKEITKELNHTNQNTMHAVLNQKILWMQLLVKNHGNSSMEAGIILMKMEIRQLV